MGCLLKCEVYPRKGCTKAGKESWFYPDRKRFAFSNGDTIIEVKTKALEKAIRDIREELKQERKKRK